MNRRKSGLKHDDNILDVQLLCIHYDHDHKISCDHQHHTWDHHILDRWDQHSQHICHETLDHR